MRVAEHFYSIQGEGVTMGVPAVFLRLSGCNLVCGGWGTIKDKKLHEGAAWRCDTIETWMKGASFSPEALTDEFRDASYLQKFQMGAHLVITGGEPLLQAEAIRDFILKLYERYALAPYVEIETNGTISPPLHISVAQYNVSLKLSSSGMPKLLRINPSAIRNFVEHGSGSYPCAWYKFVVSSLEDLEEIERDFIQPFLIPRERVILMPACSNREQLDALLPVVAEWAKQMCYKLSSRLQIAIWNEVVGV